MLFQSVTYFLLLTLEVSAQTFNPLRIPIDFGEDSCSSTNDFQSARDQLAALVAEIRQCQSVVEGSGKKL